MVKAKTLSGFTLVEVVLVAVLIAVLAGIVATAMPAALRNSRDARRKADLAKIQTALEQYKADRLGYPICTNLGGCDPDSSLSNLTPTYIASITKDPKNSNPYVYTYFASCLAGPPVVCRAYQLKACLENPNDPDKNTTFAPQCAATPPPATYVVTQP